MSLEEIPQLITQLEAQMKEAAKKLEFEEAAKYRDRREAPARQTPGALNS